MDIAFPKKNEKEFQKDVVFFYPNKDIFKSDKKTLYKSTGNDRKYFEKGIDFIYYLEFGRRNDFIFHRNSSMNQVLAKIAKDKNITICFSFNDWKKAKNKAEIFGRMQQNYFLCKKYKVKTLVASFASFPDEIVNDLILDSFKRLLDKRKLY